MINQGLPQIKTVSHGELHVLMFPLGEFVAARKEKKTTVKPDNIKSDILNMTAESLAALKAANVPMYRATLKADHCLYIPTGWMLAERADKASGLIYGCRKSFCMAGGTAPEKFKDVVEFMEGSKGIQKYKDCMQAIAAV